MAVQVPMCVNKSYLHIVFQNCDQTPWVCAVRSLGSNTHYVVCSTCLKSGWNYLAKSERSVSRMLPKKWKTCQCHCKRYCKMYPVTAKGCDKMHLFFLIRMKKHSVTNVVSPNKTTDVWCYQEIFKLFLKLFLLFSCYKFKLQNICRRQKYLCLFCYINSQRGYHVSC